MSLDKLAQMMQGFDLNGLQKMVDNMQSIQKQHVTVGGVTFDKTELKRAEPTKQNDTPTWQISNGTANRLASCAMNGSPQRRRYHLCTIAVYR